MHFNKIFGLVIAGLAMSAQAALKTERVEYRDGKTPLEGVLVYDDVHVGARPAVIVVHQWMGHGAHEARTAERLAEQGYVAFVADIYGKGVKPTNREAAAKLSGRYKGDVATFRAREKAAIDFVQKQKRVDAKKIVIMGYCFGGTGALEAARAGYPVVGAVSFHGGLGTSQPADAKKLKAKLLVLHGAIDPNVPPEQVSAFQKEMEAAKADYQFIAYAGAVHSFTEKEAGNDISKGAAYNEAADRRSWLAFMNFLSEVAPLPQ